MDRIVLGMVLQDIKTDLNLSDGQLGILTGIAFFMFYAVMGIPIARWADRGNRVVIIAGATALWSLMMVLCATVGNFFQLLMVRVGAGVGEAGCNPPALSLISDYFSRAERPRAIARFTLGWSLSLLIGYFAAGWLNQFFGWRMTFVLMGAPGVGLAAMLWLTVQDPRKSDAKRNGAPSSPGLRSKQVEQTDPARPSLISVVRSLRGNATFRHLTMYQVIGALLGVGMNQFQPAFMIRSYGMNSGEVGTFFALTYGIAGLLGTYWGGEWASRHAANNERLQLRAAAGMFSLLALCSALMFLTSNLYLTFGLMGVLGLTAAVMNGPIFATLQTLVPPEKRATSIALIYLLTSLIGGGLGPLAVGVLSDIVRPWLGGESLRCALLSLTPGYLWGGWHLWQASKTVTHDLGPVDQGSDDKSESTPGNSVAKTTIAQ